MSWWIAARRHGTIRIAARAMRTSVGRGVANCWLTRFEGFSGRGSPPEKLKPSGSGCSPSRHESAANHGKYRLPEASYYREAGSLARRTGTALADKAVASMALSRANVGSDSRPAHSPRAWL